jgi:predicted Zn-dependent peptidase
MNSVFPLRASLAVGSALAWMALAPPAHAAFKDLADDVTTFTLDNGLRFVVVERHDAPVFSFATLVDAGGVDEVPGITGVAHMYEHMAFKGSPTIGTLNYEQESEALAAVDAAFAAWLDEHRKAGLGDEATLEAAKTTLDEAVAAARAYVKTNEFSQILESNGVNNLNAGTGLDYTVYFYNLPSNKLELWARLEGDRLATPVTREFETERAVVIEERRMQFDSSPFGKLMGNFISMSFPAHPYGDGVIGHTSDLMTFTRDDAHAFYDTYYVGSNMTIAVVGDVDADDVKKFAKKYFSGVRKGPDPAPVDTVEPEQVGARRLVIEDASQPMMMIGYPIPSAKDPDYTAYELLSSVIGGGRSSRLTEKLVKDAQVAVQAQAFTGFPGEKYPNLFTMLVVSAAGEDPEAVEDMVYDIVEKDLRDNPVTQAELDGARARVKAALVRSLRSNSGLASMLATFDQQYGGWEELFNVEERIGKVTVDDLNRVAAETFIKSNRNVGIIVNPQEDA